MSNMKVNFNLFILAIFFALFFIMTGCNSGGSDNNDSQLLASTGAPILLDVSLRSTHTSNSKSMLIIGDTIELIIRVEDSELDITRLHISSYLLSESEEYPVETMTVDLPEQLYPEMKYYTTESDPLLGPFGHWRFSFQIEDSLGNMSEIFYVSKTIIQFYSYEFLTDDIGFNDSHTSLYCSSKSNKKVYSINTDTGAVQAEHNFNYMPEAIAVTPDKKRMYVALLTREHSWYWYDEDQEGYIAEFDLETGKKLKEFKIDIDPFDLVATSEGYLFVSGGSGQSTDIKGFNIETEQCIDARGIRQLNPILLHPSEFYILSDRSGGCKIKDDDGNPTIEGSTSPGGYYGYLDFDLTGNLVVGKDGSIYSRSLYPDLNKRPVWEFVQNISENDDIQDIAFDPIHGLIYTIEPEGIKYYDYFTFNLIGEITLSVSDSGYISLNQDSSKIFYIQQNERNTHLMVLPVPIDILDRSNDVPLANFEITPGNASTMDAVIFDATASKNTIPSDELFYRWDWESDGIFDTEYSSKSNVYHTFTTPGIHEITLMVIDKWGLSRSIKKEITIQGDPLPDITVGKITDMCAGNAPEFVYAIDQDNQSLYYLNTLSQKIVKKVDLSLEQPISLSFSSTDNSLYVLSGISNQIIEYQLDSGNISDFSFSGAGTGQVIEVESSLKRIYILSKEIETYINKYNIESTRVITYVFIIDMDTRELLFQGTVEGHSAIINAYKQKLYTSKIIYSLEDDVLNAEITIPDHPMHIRPLAVSQDGARLACSVFGLDNYTYDFDAINPDNILGEWKFAADVALFSPGGEYFYAIHQWSHSQFLHIFTVDQYRGIDSYYFPNSDKYAVFTPNSDSSVIIGFSYDTWGDDEHKFYFFNDIQTDNPLDSTSMGKVTEMIGTNDPESVYGIDEAKQILYQIDATSKEIIKSITLPHPQPLAISYSDRDNCLYIVSKYSGSITVYDLNTALFYEIPFSYAADGRDIEVAPDLRRIYVLSTNNSTKYLSILNMDSGDLIQETTVIGSSFVLSETSKMIFIVDPMYSIDIRIHKYSIAEDDIMLIQSIERDYEHFGDNITISPDGMHLLIHADGKIYDIDASNLENILGEWSVEAWNSFYNIDGTILYAFTYKTLYVLNALSYQVVRKIDLFDPGDYSVLALNGDGSKIIGYRKAGFNNNMDGFYCFTDIHLSEPSEQTTLGAISDMIDVNDPEFVYAIDQDHQLLYQISTSAEEIVNNIKLPYTQPLAMAYSGIDNTLYVVSKFSGMILAYDLNTSTISEISFSETFDGRNIVTAPSLRRIYVISESNSLYYLHIIEMDTGAILNEVTVNGKDLVVDESRKKLFIFGDRALSAYSIDEDQLTLIQRSETGWAHHGLSISPDGNHITLALNNYIIADYNTENLKQIGEWQMGGYYTSPLTFNHDGTILYGYNDHKLYVMDGTNYKQIRLIDFPNSDYCVVLTPNSNGTVVVGFSYDNYDIDKHQLYFCKNVGMPEPPLPYELGKVSDMTTGSNPEYVYALDQENQVLCVINTQSQEIETTIDLPYTQPLAMDYSEIDNELYIIYKFADYITIYDIETFTITNINLSSFLPSLARDIAVAPGMRRIYALSWNNLAILDLDSKDIVTEVEIDGGVTLVVNEQEQTIFTAKDYYIYKYNISSDEVAFVQETRTGTNGEELEISPDGLHLVFPCGAGNGTGYTIYDYDTTNLENVFGEWIVGPYPGYAKFSPDGSILYATGEGAYLQIIDAYNYNAIRQLPFTKNSDSIFTPNSNGTIVVGFTYGNDKSGELFYFTDVEE